MPLRKERTAPWTPTLLGEGASRKLGGGVGGAFYASGGAVGFVTPDDFSLVPPGGTVSGGEAATVLLRRADECRRSTKGARVSGDRSLLNHGAPTAPRTVGNKKEIVGPTVPHTECGFLPSRARGAESPSPPAADISRTLCGFISGQRPRLSLSPLFSGQLPRQREPHNVRLAPRFDSALQRCQGV